MAAAAAATAAAEEAVFDISAGGSLHERELRRVTKFTGSPRKSALSPKRKPRPMPPPASESRTKALADVATWDAAGNHDKQLKQLLALGLMSDRCAAGPTF